MNKQQVLEQTGLGEFLDAKFKATEQRIGDWLDTDNNLDKALVAGAAGFSAVSAGTETAANLLRQKEGRKGQVQRGALHAATLLSLAGAGAALYLEGMVRGYEEETTKH